MCVVMQRSNAEVKWVQTEDVSASQENITGWPHGFRVSEFEYAKVEYRGHGNSQEYTSDFTVLVLCDNEKIR
jgi:hypothetical protein